MSIHFLAALVYFMKRPMPADPSVPDTLPNRRSASQPKYRQVYEHLHHSIETGELNVGDRLPSETELGQRFSASRITIARALNQLEEIGLVSRRAGSGTHVLSPARVEGRVFGLLIPDLGRTEIFEPICHGMMRSPLARPHSLLWGHAMGEAEQQEREAEDLCRHYIAQKVSGVFLAPLELTPKKDVVNQRIVDAYRRAHIPVVLLDRCVAPYPQRSPFDLVGIDNRRTGFLMTQHLLRLGARRLAFVARPLSASTVDARIAGYREALFDAGLRQEDLVRRGDPDDLSFIQELVKDTRPDACVCANDMIAARVMQNFKIMGLRVPEDVRVVGIDDVKYASMLPIPLTTHHQNCVDLGEMAIASMLQRIARPDMPPRDILLQTRLIVRRSCGANSA